jgi:hypothetical protein
MAYKDLDVRNKKLKEYRAKHREALNDYSRRYFLENRERLTAAAKERYRKGLDSRLKKRFGISLQDYDRMLVAQDGRCAICRTDKPGTRACSVLITTTRQEGCVGSCATAAT